MVRLREYSLSESSELYILNCSSSKLEIKYSNTLDWPIPVVQKSSGYDDEYFPLSILKHNSSFEAIVHYLKYDSGLSLKKISELTSRDQRTIWNVYNDSQKKSIAYDVNSDIFLPLSIIRNRLFSVLESIVFYLQSERSMSVNQIASALGKNNKTIYTIHQRIIKKLGNFNEGN